MCDLGRKLTADVVIIGAGIVGASCAYALSCVGLAVHVVDAAAPARRTSGACEGNLTLWDRPNSADLALARWSNDRWAELAVELRDETGINIEFDRKGGLMVASTEEDLAVAQSRCRWLSVEGVRSEWLAGSELRKAEPALSPSVLAGAYFPNDAQLEPRLAVAALIAAAHRRGAVIHNYEPAHAIVAREPAMVQTLYHSINAPWVVVAAGVWTPEVLRPLGIVLPVSARKGQIAVVAGAQVKIRHKVAEVGYFLTVASEQTNLQIAADIESTQAGTILVGSSRLTCRPDDRGTDLDVLRQIVARSVELVPGLASGRIIRGYAGVRPMSPDHTPIVGPLPMLPHVIVATGHEGGGIMMGPGTGDLVAHFVAGTPSHSPTRPYLPDRLFDSTSAVN